MYAIYTIKGKGKYHNIELFQINTKNKTLIGKCAKNLYKTICMSVISYYFRRYPLPIPSLLCVWYSIFPPPHIIDYTSNLMN